MSIDSPPPSAPPPVRPSLVGWARRRWFWLTPLGFIAVVVGLLAWLAIGGLPAGFLAPSIEAAIARTAGDQARIEIGDVFLTWDPARGRVRFSLVDVIVRDPVGTEIVRVPDAETAFALSALLDGEIAPRVIELKRLAATLVRRDDGRLELGIVDPDAPRAEPAEAVVRQSDPRIVEAMLAALLAPPDSGDPRTFLRAFTISQATLTFIDSATGTTITAPDAQLQLERAQKGVTATLDAGIDLGDGEPGVLRASGLYERGSERIDLEASFDPVHLDRLARTGALFAFLKPLAIPLSGRFTGSLNTDGEFTEMRLAVEIGEGTLSDPGGRAAADSVRSGALDATFLPQTGEIAIERLTLDSDRIHGTLIGNAVLATGPDGTRNLEGAITGDNVVFSWPGFLPQALNLDRVSLRGAADFGVGLYRIDEAGFRSHDFAVSLSGEIAETATTPSINLNGTLEKLPVADILTFWPQTMGAGARDWIERNLSAGMITQGSVVVAIPEGGLAGEYLPDEMLNLTFAFEGVEANYLTGLPHITDAAGKATLLGDTFSGEVTRGRVGAITLRDGAIRIPTLHIPRGPSDLSVTASGGLTDILKLIDHEPLGYARRMNLDPEAVEGEGTIDLALVVPMKKDLDVEEIVFDIEAQAKDLALPLGEDARLSSGDVAFDIDGAGLKANGGVALNGVPLRIAWDEAFSGGGQSTRLKVTGNLDEAARNQLGLTIAGIDGPIALSASLRGNRLELSQGSVSLDFARTALDITEVAYQKPAGQPLEATFDVALSGGGALRALKDVRVSGTGVAIEGEIERGANGELTSALFPKVVLGPNHDFRLRYQIEETVPQLTIDGERVDASGFFKGLEGGPPSPPVDSEQTTPLVLNVNVKELVLRQGVRLRNAALELTRGTAGIEAFRFDATGAAGPVHAHFAPASGGAKQLVATTGDAGEVLRGTLGFESLIGGTLTIEGSAQGSLGAGPVSGLATLRNFKVMNQPFLARLFAAGSFTGLTDLLSGSGITFTKLLVPFQRSKTMWRFDEARASSPSIGVTADGVIDRTSDQANITGTLVPLYGLNSMLEDVPLLGDILSGRKGEGILGVTYAVRGKTDDLTIAVNPLSAVAPGILRRLFEFGDATPAPQ